jgi:hypothetical protein
MVDLKKRYWIIVNREWEANYLLNDVKSTHTDLVEAKCAFDDRYMNTNKIMCNEIIGLFDKKEGKMIREYNCGA